MLQGIMDSTRLAVDISDNILKAVYGNSSSIKCAEILKLEDNCITDGKIIDMEAVRKALDGFIVKTNIKNRNVSFSIHGQDVVVRQIECPALKEKGLREAAEWEIGQNLPGGGENHYIDYEVLDKKDIKKNKSVKLMVAAAPREKVDQLISLSQKLKLKVQSVDVYSNCIVRVFNRICRNGKAVGILDMGDVTTSFTIIDNGKLFIDREVPFGLNNIKYFLARRENIGLEFVDKHIYESIDFSALRTTDEVQSRMKIMLDNMCSTFQNVIRFYNMGRTEQDLEYIYVIGAGAKLKGFEFYIKSYFGCKVQSLSSQKVMNHKIKLPSDVDYSKFISTIGLLMRKE